MSKFFKRILPSRVKVLLYSLRKKIIQRDYPALRRFKGTNSSVLQCCIAYNKFGGYCVPLSSHHRPAAQKILSGDVWELDTIEYISKNCKGGDIVHAGAYFGDFLPALSKACKSDAKIFAFEPNPENFRCASITVMVNDLRNIVLTNAALGSENCSHPMLILDKDGNSLGGASRLTGTGFVDDVRSVEVRVIKVDDVIPVERNITIIQLDVERFEQPALLGAMETIKRCKPILILEHIPDRDWFAENILSLGYKNAGKAGPNIVYKSM